MLLTGRDAEEIALGILRRSGGERATLRRIVQASGMRVRIAKGLLTEAAKATVGGVRTICLRPRLHPVRSTYLQLHEVVEEEFDRLGIHGEGRETAANYVAAALNCPREPFLAAVRSGMTLPRIGAAFCASQTMVALRRAELLAEPRAVVCPHRVYVRWDGRPLPEEQWRSSSRTRPWLRRTRLTDQKDRVAVEPALVG